MTWPTLPEPWGVAMSIAWLLYILALGVWIVLQKRPPLSTLAWILSLAALPVLGFLIYFYLGPQKIKRQRMRRQRMRTLQKAHAPSSEDDPLTDLPRRKQTLGRLLRATTGMPVSTASTVELLIGGEATFAALLSAIEAAQEHVHVAYYTFDPDRVGAPMLEALTAAATRGVRVRLLVDSVGSPKLHRRHHRALRKAGGEVAVFHPFRLATLKPLLNLRLHRKIVVVDGVTGFTGGVNITEDEHEGLNPDAFHDLHLRIDGQVVGWLQTLFAEDWAYASKRPLADSELYPSLPAGAIAAQIVGSGPEGLWEPIHRLHLQAIADARERVWLATPYFVPGEAALFALSNAALRGVDVRVMVPRRSDSAVVTFAARSYFDELMEAGVRIYEYQPRMLHCKTLLVDADCAVIGSANFDQRSFRLNFEVCAAIYDVNIASQLSEEYERGFSRSRRVSRPRSVDPLRRLAEAFARLLSPLL